MAATSPAPRPNREKLSVRLRFNKATGYPEIKASHPLPPTEAVVRRLPKPLQTEARSSTYISTHTDLASVIAACKQQQRAIKAADWTKAILSAMHTRSIGRDDYSEVELVAHTGPAFLSMGNHVFQLSAVDLLQTGPRALPALRNSVMAHAKEEATTILEEADLRARDIRAKAQADANRVQRETERARETLNTLREEARSFQIAPAWVRDNGIPHHYYRETYWANGEHARYHLNIHFHAAIRLSTFEFTFSRLDNTTNDIIDTHRRTWNARRHHPILVPLSIKINSDGTYSLRELHILKPFKGTMPHIDYGSSCMSIGDAPPTLTSVNHLNTLKACIERVHATVNLSSLLGDWINWHTAFKRAIPPHVRAVIGDRYNAVIVPPPENNPDIPPCRLATIPCDSDEVIPTVDAITMAVPESVTTVDPDYIQPHIRTPEGQTPPELEEEEEL